jgi:hypothetical protein
LVQGEPNVSYICSHYYHGPSSSTEPQITPHPSTCG